LPVRDALRAAEEKGKYPILLADHADNTGGGAPGDSTEVLRTFLELDLKDALILYMVDPEVALQAHANGVGSRSRVQLGGKSSPRQGAPVLMDAEIVAVSDGAFAYDGPMYAGAKGNMGCSAWLRERGVSVVVVTSREQPLDPGFARTLGIDCGKFRYIVLKSAVHFRSGFEAIAGQIYNVDAAAILSHDVATLPWRRRTRPMFPIEIKPSKKA
jgi:microcystin degradation protein MlrC